MYLLDGPCQSHTALRFRCLALAGTSTVEEEGMDDFAWVPSVQNSGAGLPKTKTVLQVRQADR